MANSLTGQVSLEMLDSHAQALSESGKKVRSADLIEDPAQKGNRGRE